MAKRCANGHYYGDNEAACPYCSGDKSLGVTIPLDGAATTAPAANNNAPAVGVTIPLGATPTVGVDASANVGTTVPLRDDNNVTLPPQPNANHTQYIDDAKNSETKPVRGWLVVIEGKKLGLDFRICNGKNTVGRNPGNDICINFDQTISGDEACTITYDDKDNSFYIVDGNNRNVIRINGRGLRHDADLVDNDVVEIGETKLIFRALCNAQFKYGAQPEAAE